MHWLQGEFLSHFNLPVRQNLQESCGRERFWKVGFPFSAIGESRELLYLASWTEECGMWLPDVSYCY